MKPLTNNLQYTPVSFTVVKNVAIKMIDKKHKRNGNEMFYPLED